MYNLLKKKKIDYLKETHLPSAPVLPSTGLSMNAF
jgi:hypothetical protein